MTTVPFIGPDKLIVSYSRKPPKMESPAAPALPTPPALTGLTIERVRPPIPRNDPCPCGSGKKYKNCHIRSEAHAPHREPPFWQAVPE